MFELNFETDNRFNALHAEMQGLLHDFINEHGRQPDDDEFADLKVQANDNIETDVVSFESDESQDLPDNDQFVWNE
jgi:hypothetical protein